MSAAVVALALAGAGCGGGAATTCDLATSGLDARYVVDRLLIPEEKSRHAYDLNGDKKRDNQLGNVSGSLQSGGIDMSLAGEISPSSTRSRPTGRCRDDFW